MNRLVILQLLIALISCQQNSEKTDFNNQSDQIKSASDSASIQQTPTKVVSKQREQTEDKSLDEDRVSLTQPTVIVVQKDSAEIEEIKRVDGEGNFYTATDDLMYYNSQLLDKMDSLKIPVIFDKKDTVNISTPNVDYNLIKDSSFTLYTYFFFDGDTLERKELFELLGF